MAVIADDESLAAWVARGRRTVAGAARRGLDLIFPPSCLACRKAVDAAGGLCPACWRAMRFIERPYCDRLGTPFSIDYGGTLISPTAAADPPVFERARAVARFEDGPARRLVHRLKYADRTDLARFMAAWMARAGSELLADCDIVVPVPLHPGRLMRRQFNQAGALAAAIASTVRKPYAPEALKRVKATRSQVGLSRTQRAENVQGAFQVRDSGAVRGRRVLLVDDVMTSGATANAASRALLRAGAKAVDVAIFARVVTDA